MIQLYILAGISALILGLFAWGTDQLHLIDTGAQALAESISPMISLV